MSFKYRISLSQSFGLYTLPVFELITIHVCCNFWRTWTGEVWALQWTIATWVERRLSKQCRRSNLENNSRKSRTSFIWFRSFLGFTGTFFSNSEWGSTQNVLMIVLHWSKQISQNCTHLLANTRSTHTMNFFSVWWQCIDLELTASEIYDVAWNPRIVFWLSHAKAMFGKVSWRDLNRTWYTEKTRKLKQVCWHLAKIVTKISGYIRMGRH